MAKKRSSYTPSQGTKFSISKEPATDATATTIEFLGMEFTAKDLSYSAGQKTDIDVTTLGSTEQEAFNGLPGFGEFSISGNWAGDNEGQDTLREAYETDAQHAFKVEFPTGTGFVFLAETQKADWSLSTNGIVSATFNLRLSGRLIKLEKPKAAAKTGATK